MSRGVNEVSTESHRNRGRLSFATEFIKKRRLEIARHPFRWLLISLRSINRHRAPVLLAVAAAAAPFGMIYANASERGHLKRSFSGPQVARAQDREAGCERSNLTQYAPKRARAGT
jgi:hypothetical protein